MTGPLILADHVIPLADLDAQTRATKEVLRVVFPAWDIDNIKVTSLTGGITNCLLKCIYKAGSAAEKIVLVRAYGRGTGSIIDRNREFCTHVHLHSQGLAPPLFARFKNGLVYGFIPGRAVDYQELSHPLIMKGVARMLARWHTVLSAASIKSLMAEQPPSSSSSSSSSSNSHKEQQSEAVDDIWQLCNKWINNLPTDTPEQISRRELLLKELIWVKSEIEHKGGTTVVAHCDLLSGNVIVPKDWRPSPPPPSSSSSPDTDAASPPITFIDYEYALPTPRAFDLANHFMEWQGFDCDVSRIPKVGSPIMRKWVAEYLAGTYTYSSSSSSNGHSKQSSSATIGSAEISEKAIDGAISEVEAWWGMPGFYWGIWAAIQAVISTIDFDYSNYAEQRLSEYWSWKENYLAKQKQRASNL